MLSELKCSFCEEYKTIDDFSKVKSTTRGRAYICRHCMRKTKRDYYVGNRDKMLTASANVYQKNLANIKIRHRQYEKAHPEKRRAKSVVRRALKKGIITRPGECSNCAMPCKPDGHHDDYSRPLKVRWLCRSCHTIHHQAAA